MATINRPRAILAAMVGAFFLLSPGTATAAHFNTEGDVTVQFEHAGDNEWWVEVLVRMPEGDSTVTVEAKPSSGDWHHLQHIGNEGDWAKWVTNGQNQFRIPPGDTVTFRAWVIEDGTGDGTMVESCAFTHPDGVELCEETPPEGFDATFTGVRGNEWWVQANVVSDGPAIAKVEATIDDGQTWKPLTKRTWGPNAWAASFHIADGSIVRLRATATNGETDLSACREWIPPSGQNAPIVPCGEGFQATFSDVGGNKYWQELRVSANKPVVEVIYTTDCKDPDVFGTSRYHMQYRADWGKWVSNDATLDGAKLTFYAYAENPDVPSGYDRAASRPYSWPTATPTTC